MHLHILGICGTFMGGIAALARAAGHRVTGSDANVYPPMSTQLEALGIGLIEGYEPAQLDLEARRRGRRQCHEPRQARHRTPAGQRDAVRLRPRVARRERSAGARGRGRRGHARQDDDLVDAGLDPAGRRPRSRLPDRRHPGELRRLGAGRRRRAIRDRSRRVRHRLLRQAREVRALPAAAPALTNLEFDHADIYPDLASIQRQFHHLVRTVPASGRITWNAADAALEATLAMGAWTPLTGFAREREAEWRARLVSPDGSAFEVLHRDAPVGIVRWPHDRPAQRGERPRGHRLRGRHGRAARAGRRGARALRRREAAARVARRGGRHPRLRRFRASPDGGRDHDRRPAPAGGRRAHRRRAGAALQHDAPRRAPRGARRSARGRGRASGSTNPRVSTGTSTTSQRSSGRRRASSARCLRSSRRWPPTCARATACSS